MSFLASGFLLSKADNQLSPLVVCTDPFSAQKPKSGSLQDVTTKRSL